jgi:N-formylglutamate amidohydrolase
VPAIEQSVSLSMLIRFKPAALAVFLYGLAACSDSNPAPPDPPDETPASIGKVTGDGQVARVSAPVGVDPTVEVRDAGGNLLGGVVVSFNVTRGNGWVTTASITTDQSGRASTRWYLGSAAADSQHVMATAGTVSVRFEADAVSPAVGQRTFGPDSFIEWIAGDLPIVLSAPHGGAATPSWIPDRTSGTTTRDLNTEELAREIGDAFAQRLGRRPHVILSRIHRRKLDPNREIIEAAAGNPDAEIAWREYHGFISAAIAEARRNPTVGFYLDLHGHGHPIQRIELGYMLSAATLDLSDAQLNADPAAANHSARAFVLSANRTTSDVIRGPVSLGAWLEREGYASVPSPSDPRPGEAPYFSGGYSTDVHGRPTDNRFGGVQVELNFTGLRDTPENRQAFASRLVTAVEGFLRDHQVFLR